MKKLTLEAPVDERTPEEIEAARPIALPAGAYDEAELNKAAHLKNPEKREEAIAAANQTKTTDPGMPGYTRVEVTDEALGITESRLVATPAPEEPEEPAAKVSTPPTAPHATGPVDSLSTPKKD